MKSLHVREVIGGDLHELYQVDEEDDLTQIPWLIRYMDCSGYPGNNLKKITYMDDARKWCWIPVPIIRLNK